MRLPRLVPVGLLVLAVGFLFAEGPATGSAPIVAEGGGVSANYALDDYRVLIDRARGAVAVANRQTHRPHASGVLLAPDLVLTCRHATHVGRSGLKRRAPEGLEVQLEATGGGRWTFPVTGYAHTSEVLDLCVLRLGPDPEGRLPEADRVQVLSSERVGLGAPVYVLHHPYGGALRVADDAHVLFPFEATDAEIDAVEARLRAESGGASSALAACRSSYRRDASGRWRCFSRRWAGQPVLGADCATQVGSSGAPVYAKETHGLVGILFAGTSVEPRARHDSWQDHEAVLPSAAILADLATSQEPALQRLVEASGAGR